MNPANQLETVYFINIPKDFKFSETALQVDPTIPLPVQKKQQDAPGNYDTENIAPEQILAGILTVLAYDKHNKHQPFNLIACKANHIKIYWGRYIDSF